MRNTTKIFAATLLVSAFAASAAHAQTRTVATKTTRTQTRTVAAPYDTAPQYGFYVAGQAGINMPTRDDDTLDNDAVYGGALGYRLHPNVRLEGEVSHRENDGDDTSLGVLITGETKITSALVNAYYDFKNTSPFTPYLGAGAGFAHGKLELAGPGGTAEESDDAFAWQGIAGVSFDITPRFAVTTDYRYFDTANFDDIGDDYSAHEVRAGVRYSF